MPVECLGLQGTAFRTQGIQLPEREGKLVDGGESWILCVGTRDAGIVSCVCVCVCVCVCR